MDTAPATDPPSDPPTEDPDLVRHRQLVGLVEEIAEDNTTLVALLHQLSRAQSEAAADTARDLAALRTGLTTTLAFRATKDLCEELIGPLTATEAMLASADFGDPVVIREHVHGLASALRQVLNRVGAEKIAVAVGVEIYDPARHRCTAVLDAADSPFPDAVPGTVVRVVEDGYLLHHLPLRPANVEIQAGTSPDRKETTHALP